MKKIVSAVLFVLGSTLSASEGKHSDICITSTEITENHVQTYALPSAEVLHQRLKFIGFKDFAHKTTLVEQLCNKETSPLDVCMRTTVALIDYQDKYVLNDTPPLLSQQRSEYKTSIVTAILQDHPEAITSLKNQGIIN